MTGKVDFTEPLAPEWASRLVRVPGEWYDKPPPKREWLLRDVRTDKARGVFPLGKVGQLIAGGGVGKTLVLCQLAVSVATGAPWLGAFSVPRAGRVLLVLGEEDAEEAQRRLYNARSVSGGAAPEPGAIDLLPLAGVIAPMQELDAVGNVVDAPFGVWLREYVNAGGFRLVVVDPLSRFGSPKSETENRAATAFIQSLETLAAPDRSVLNAHHVNQPSRANGAKLDATSGRGVTGSVDGARWQCGLSVEELKFDSLAERQRLGEIVTFSVTKSNYAPKPEPVLLRRDDNYGGALLPLDDSDLETIELARQQSTSKGRRTAEKQSEAAKKAEEERKTKRARDDQAAAEQSERQLKHSRALVAILRAHPEGLTVSDVESKLKAALGTMTNGHHKVVREWVGAEAIIEKKVPPPAHHLARLWCLVETELPPHLRVIPVTPDVEGVTPEAAQ